MSAPLEESKTIVVADRDPPDLIALGVHPAEVGWQPTGPVDITGEAHPDMYAQAPRPTIEQCCDLVRARSQARLAEWQALVKRGDQDVRVHQADKAERKRAGVGAALDRGTLKLVALRRFAYGETVAYEPASFCVWAADLKPKEGVPISANVMLAELVVHCCTKGRRGTWWPNSRIAMDEKECCTAPLDASFETLISKDKSWARRAGVSPQVFRNVARRVCAYYQNITAHNSGKVLGAALYDTFNAINHSCVPNTTHFFDVDGGQYLVANRDIAQDEEITCTYDATLLFLPCGTRIERTLGFTCRCEPCRLGKTYPLGQQPDTPLDKHFRTRAGEITLAIDLAGQMALRVQDIQAFVGYRTAVRTFIACVKGLGSSTINQLLFRHAHFRFTLIHMFRFMMASLSDLEAPDIYECLHMAVCLLPPPSDLLKPKALTDQVASQFCKRFFASVLFALTSTVTYLEGNQKKQRRIEAQKAQEAQEAISSRTPTSDAKTESVGETVFECLPLIDALRQAHVTDVDTYLNDLRQLMLDQCLFKFSLDDTMDSDVHNQKLLMWCVDTLTSITPVGQPLQDDMCLVAMMETLRKEKLEGAKDMDDADHLLTKKSS